MAADPFIVANLVTQGIALTGGRRESDIRQMVKRQLLLASEFYITEVKLAGPEDKGYMRGGWDAKYEDQEQLVRIGNIAEYTYNLEKGRKPGKGIPLVPLTLWVRRKIGVKDERKARSIAFCISRKAKLKGLAAKPFVLPTLNAVLPAINNTFISPLGALLVKALGG